MDINILWLLVAFGGGAFGAAIGPQTAFILTGFAYLFGLAGLLATGGDNAMAGAFIDTVAFGPIFGPHIAWAGGAAGSAYAAYKGYMESGRDVVSPLAGLAKFDVLAVAGVFGMGGYLFERVLHLVPVLSTNDGTAIGWTDTVALTVVISHVVARMMFGKASKKVFGPFPNGRPLVLDDGSHWVEHQERWGLSAGHGFTSGMIFAFGAIWLVVNYPGNEIIQSKAFLIGWAVSALTLTFLTCGLKTPVTHHMTLIAALAGVISLQIMTQGGSIGDATMTQMVIATLIGAVMGAVSGLWGELLSRLMNARGDTHIDPPALAIFSLTTVLFIVKALAM
ncbi:hypothetical protein [Nigerium massiliense]|uniref:hypothetical protein n=1 Tax=Nigerium massiliense TaxID=1522317 RepID=UPI000693E682|nr:hypothetical protein [Nigerium massiliense]